jgi:hypothetical protein
VPNHLQGSMLTTHGQIIDHDIVVRTPAQSHPIFVEGDNFDHVVVQTYDNFCHNALLYKLINDYP